MRRRKTKYTWLPTLGTVGDATENDDSSGLQFSVTTALSGDSSVLISAVTFDEPRDADNTSLGTPMDDFLGSEYILKRIVGKVFAGVTQVGADAQPPAVLFGAGFFVARAADSAQSTNQLQPIGSQSLSERQENYSPLSVDAIRAPWIWRRTWILSNNLATPIQGNFTSFPPTTAQYGSVMDGPHIDAKTGRRIGRDDRLWFVVAARNFPLDLGTQDSGTLVLGYLDYRLLGRMARAKNKSVF